MKNRHTFSHWITSGLNKPRWLAGMVSAIAISMLLSCEKDLEPTRSATDLKLTNTKILLKYEIETVTIPELENVDKADQQAIIMALPFSTRNKVEVSISENGASNWRIERMEPKTDLAPLHLSPRGVEPETHLTVIDESGMGSFYDAKGTLLHTNPVPIPSYKEMMLNFNSNPNSLFSILGGPSIENLSQIIETAKAVGGIVQDLGNNMVSVRTGENWSGIARGVSILDNTSKVDIYNKDLGLCLGSTLYNEQNQILCQTFYSYSVTPDQRWFANKIYMKGWNKDPSTGKMVAQESTTYFENVTINIKNL